MTTPPGSSPPESLPPPWPLPPSWTPAPFLPGPSVVTVLGLGGTISMAGGSWLSVASLIGALPDLGLPGVAIESRDVRSVASSTLTLDDAIELAAVIDRTPGTGVVVVQGTDTMEEMAWALDLLHTGDRPVVLTGAMRFPTMAGSDGLANLAAAIQVAASGVPGLGAVVVLNDEIHAARHVRKTHASSPSAFASPGAGPLGHVDDGGVRLWSRPSQRITVAGPHNLMSPRVGIYTATMGDDGVLLAELGGHCDGLVIAGFGAGNVPEPMLPILSRLAERIPVVEASRTGVGAVQVGVRNDLDPVKSRVLMHLLLAAGRSRDEVLAAFTGPGARTRP